MNKICDYCEVSFPVKKGSLKKELAFKKGHTCSNESMHSYYFKYRWFKGTVKVEVGRSYDFKCTQNLYNSFFVCPVCNEKTYVEEHHEPFHNFCLDDGWVCTREERIEREVE